MSEEKKIGQLRKRIDRIDREIITLLSERVHHSAEIGRLKSHLGKPVIDEQRESELARRITELAGQYDLDIALVNSIWQLILKESYRVQHVPK